MKRSFGFWLMTVFTISILLPLLLLTTILTVVFRVMFNQQTESMFSASLHSISVNLSMYTEDLGRLSMTPYYSSEMMEHLRDMNNVKYNVDMAATRGINSDYHLSLSQQLGTVRNDVIGVLFVPANGEQSFLVRRYAGALQIYDAADERGADWYTNAFEADGGLVFSSVGFPEYYGEANFHFYTNEDLNVFSIARLIKDPVTMRPIGVMKVDAVDLIIEDIFKNLPVESGSAVLLLDEDNNVIHSSDPEAYGLAAYAQPGLERAEVEGAYYTVWDSNISGTPWRLYYFASEQGVRRQTAALLVVALCLSLASFIIAMVTFRASSRPTVRSVQEVLTGLEQIADGHLDVHIDSEKAGTLAPIAEAVNRTASRLEQHIDQEYRARLSQRNAEYLALQSQINPHFLNNVLSGFVTLNQVGDRDTLEQSILRLSHLFRYTSKNNDLSTVADELTFLEEYLALQKLRFSGRLSCHVECEEAAKAIPLPKLLLQPLVENAIIHGMEPYDFNLKIDVRVSIKEDDRGHVLLMVVNDDGGGFDPNGIGPNSVGIQNIRERLHLFRESATLEIVSAEGAGCCCVLQIPLNEGDADENTVV